MDGGGGGSLSFGGRRPNGRSKNKTLVVRKISLGEEDDGGRNQNTVDCRGGNLEGILRKIHTGEIKTCSSDRGVNKKRSAITQKKNGRIGRIP